MSSEARSADSTGALRASRACSIVERRVEDDAAAAASRTAAARARPRRLRSIGGGRHRAPDARAGRARRQRDLRPRAAARARDAAASSTTACCCRRSRPTRRRPARRGGDRVPRARGRRRERLAAMTRGDRAAGAAAGAARGRGRRPLPADAADPAGRRSRPSSTLHDVQHLDLPRLFSREERAFRARRVAPLGARRRPRDRAQRVRARPRGRAARPRPGARSGSIHLGVDHDALPPGRRASASRSCSTRRGAGRTRTTTRLFEAFALLRRERPELRLVLTGGGDCGRAARTASRCAASSRARELVALLPPRGGARLPVALRGLRPAAARGDGVRLPGRVLGRRRRYRRSSATRRGSSTRTTRARSRRRSRDVLDEPERVVERAASPRRLSSRGRRRRAGTDDGLPRAEHALVGGRDALGGRLDRVALDELRATLAPGGRSGSRRARRRARASRRPGRACASPRSTSGIAPDSAATIGSPAAAASASTMPNCSSHRSSAGSRARSTRPARRRAGMSSYGDATAPLDRVVDARGRARVRAAAAPRARRRRSARAPSTPSRRSQASARSRSWWPFSQTSRPAERTRCAAGGSVAREARRVDARRRDHDAGRRRALEQQRLRRARSVAARKRSTRGIVSRRCRRPRKRR